MQSSNIKKIMIFGRPGGGKSIFAAWLSPALNLPLYHLDKHFYTKNWLERNYQEFLDRQKNIVNNASWIIDGNNTRSLEIRWAQANLVLYFNFPKVLCYYRILKLFLKPNKSLDDKGSGCQETIK